MEGPEIVALFFVLISITLVIIFCYYFGVFHLPIYAYILIIINASIPVVMVSGLLPLDISLCLFGSTPKKSKGLKTIFEVLYWASFLLTWVLVPVVVSWLRYSHTISAGTRIRLIIRENVIFYGVAVTVIVIALIIVFCSKEDFTFADIPSLGISLTTAYGLLLLCLLNGYSLIEYPRRLWKFSNARYYYLYNLSKISIEAEIYGKAINEGLSLDHILQTVRDDFSINERRENIFKEHGLPRQQDLNDQTSKISILEECYTEAPDPKKKKTKRMKKLEGITWKECDDKDFEDLFSLVDDTVINIKDSYASLQYAGHEAAQALETYNKLKNEKKRAKIKTILMKISAICIAIINAICVWSEICLMFNNKLSLFYIISHAKVNPTIAELFITGPIVGYLLFVGGWGLINLRISSFYRFIPNRTSANTLNYWAILISRLGPTIGFHYLKQIGAEGSKLVEVMGKMEKVVFIGDKWNIFSPILLIIVLIIVGFEIIQKIRINLCSNYRQMSEMDIQMLRKGEAILKKLQPDSEKLLNDNWSYLNVKSLTEEQEGPFNAILNDEV